MSGVSLPSDMSSSFTVVHTPNDEPRSRGADLPVAPAVDPNRPVAASVAQSSMAKQPGIYDISGENQPAAAAPPTETEAMRLAANLAHANAALSQASGYTQGVLAGAQVASAMASERERTLTSGMNTVLEASVAQAQNAAQAAINSTVHEF